MTLKNNIAEIKYSLSNNIQQLNEDKTHLLSIISPLRNLQSEIYSLKIRIESMNQGTSITNTNSEQIKLSHNFKQF